MSNVVIQECSSYNTELVMSKINQGIDLIGGWDSFVKPGNKVLLKVNLIGPKSSESGAVTHCEFVRAMVRVLKQQQCTVWIGDSSGGAIGGIAITEPSFEASGYKKVAEEEGAEIKNFDSEGVVKISPESGVEKSMYIAKPMFEADVVINLPKLKTHIAGIYTGAVKNLFGCIPGLIKAKYHKIAPDPKDFGEILVDIHKGVKVPLHIMDGITAMEGEGPTSGEVYSAKKVFVSTDPLALDRVAIKCIGMDFSRITILDSAKKRKLGEANLDNISIIGDYSDIPELKNFTFPKKYTSTKKQNYRALSKVIDFMKSRPIIDKKICKSCNVCIESCPVEAIDKTSKQIDYTSCIECMCCHELCMHKAVSIKKDKVLARVLSGIFGRKYR